MPLRSKRWFHGYVSRFLLVVVLVLSVLGVLVSLYLDQHSSDWIERHPITANLFATFLALPATFFIVNVAAERAVIWTEKAKWANIREEEAMDVIEAWRKARQFFSGALLHWRRQKRKPRERVRKLDKSSGTQLSDSREENKMALISS
jgi:hypothetical protein